MSSQLPLNTEESVLHSSRNYALCRKVMIGTKNTRQSLCLNYATAYPVLREKSIYSGMSVIWVN